MQNEFNPMLQCVDYTSTHRIRMMLTLLTYLNVGAAVLTGVLAECQTSVQGGTWNYVPGRDSSHFPISTVEDCHELCSSHPECQGYTWRFDDVIGWCFEYKELEDLHACAGCYSGTVSVKVDGACASTPENLIGAVSAESVEKCYESCTKTSGCVGYTWYDQTSSFPYFCFQFSDCSTVTPCQGCSSGKPNCIDQSFTTTPPSTSPKPTTTTPKPTTTTKTIPLLLCLFLTNVLIITS